MKDGGCYVKDGGCYVKDGEVVQKKKTNLRLVGRSQQCQHSRLSRLAGLHRVPQRRRLGSVIC